MQGTDRLAEAQRVAEHALEADAVAPQVRRQGDRPVRPGSRSPRSARDRPGSHSSSLPRPAGFVARLPASDDPSSPIRGAAGYSRLRGVDQGRSPRPREFLRRRGHGNPSIQPARPASQEFAGPTRTTALGKQSPGQVRPRRIAAACGLESRPDRPPDRIEVH